MNETSKQKLPVIDALHEALEKNNRENAKTVIAALKMVNKLDAGPANATFIISSLGLCKFIGLTGTGLA